MAFTDAEKESIRHHLGYPSVKPAAAMTFGLPTLIQPLFIVDLALTVVTSDGEPRIRSIVGILDGIDAKLVIIQDHLYAEAIDGLKLRARGADELEAEYVRWARRLAETLCVPLYPYAARFQRAGVGTARNVRVR